MRLLHFKKTLGPGILCLESMPNLLALSLFQHKGRALTQDLRAFRAFRAIRAFRTSATCIAVSS